MEQTKTQLPKIMLVGITARTNNSLEMDPATAVIGATVQKYFHDTLSAKIDHRTMPNTTYCVYTDYESDFNGDYTYFIGEQVSNFDNLPEGFVALTIPAQNYTKFTNGPGPMPHVCIDIWKEVWGDRELDNRRNYIADFEIYDERAADHSKVVLDIYIGVKS